MTITVGAYDTVTLIQTQQRLITPNQFWLSLCFPNVQLFDTEKIMFDEIKAARRLAPFVAPNVKGKVMKERGFTSKAFAPAYIKPKFPINPDQQIKRRAGEPLTGEMSQEQRRNAHVAALLLEEREMIERRWEWMAAQAAQHGSVTVSGEDYPTVTVDFGRNAAQTITLTGTNLWTDPASKPLTNLQTWMTQTQRLAASPVRTLVFGTTAWDAFISHASVQQKLETRRGSTMQVETALGMGNSDAFQYKGSLPGGPDLVIYSDIYEDDLGATQQMMDPTHVIGVGNVNGIRAFGAIMDGRAGYRALPIFPKMWEEEDPSVEFVMSQSAPLMIPGNPDATFRAKVA